MSAAETPFGDPARTTSRPIRLARRALGASLVILALTTSGAAVAAPAEPAAAGGYELTVDVLVGGDAGDLYLTLGGLSAGTDTMRKVQIKTFTPDGRLLGTENVFDVPAPGGEAALPLGQLARGQRVDVQVVVKEGAAHVVDATAVARLRPDLAVDAIDVPSRVVRGQVFDARVVVDERSGDTGATADLTVYDGSEELETTKVTVPAGGSTTADLALRLAGPGDHELRVMVTNAAPAEFGPGANEGAAAVAVARYDVDGAVATDHPLATEAGLRILRAGGNAFDAAAAVQFVLNVTQPHTTGIGGGATILVHTADGENVAIDAREKAPAATSPAQFVGFGAVPRGSSGFAIGVPGAVRAVEHLLEERGTMTLAQTLADAIRLAEDGFPVGAYLALATTDARTTFQPETQAVYRRPDGTPLQQGDWLRQPDLARTFRILAERGADAFYGGEIADAMLTAQLRTRLPNPALGLGRMTQADLEAYAIDVRDPAAVTYRGHRILSAPPSTSGGLSVLQALQIMEGFPIGDAEAGFGFGAPDTIHVTIEALRLAMADALYWIGDLDPYAAPISCLLSPAYAEARRAGISLVARTNPVAPGNPCPTEPLGTALAEPGDDGHTTHFSVADRWGNVVSYTTTLTDGFGTGIMVPGYGFVLNNALVNFNPTPLASSSNPGANDAGPGKRPKGNTAPVLVREPSGEVVFATGAPGGAFIPSKVLQVVSNVVDHGMDGPEAVAAPRFWFTGPTTGIGWNPGLGAETMAAVRARGHNIAANAGPGLFFGLAESIWVDAKTYRLVPVADPRGAPDTSAGVVEP